MFNPQAVGGIRTHGRFSLCGRRAAPFYHQSQILA
jgi:hypothetical protein